MKPRIAMLAALLIVGAAPAFAQGTNQTSSNSSVPAQARSGSQSTQPRERPDEQAVRHDDLAWRASGRRRPGWRTRRRRREVSFSSNWIAGRLRPAFLCLLTPSVLVVSSR